VYGTVLLLIVGWVLYAGRRSSCRRCSRVIVYVIVGLAHALGRVHTLGRALPLQLRYLFSIAAIGLVGFLFAYLVMANKERALALAPQYQQSLLARSSAWRCTSASRPSPPGDPAPGPAGADRPAADARLAAGVGRLDRRDLRRRAAVRPPSCCSSGVTSTPSWPTSPTTRRGWRASAR